MLGRRTGSFAAVKRTEQIASTMDTIQWYYEGQVGSTDHSHSHSERYVAYMRIA